MDSSPRRGGEVRSTIRFQAPQTKTRSRLPSRADAAKIRQHAGSKRHCTALPCPNTTNAESDTRRASRSRERSRRQKMVSREASTGRALLYREQDVYAHVSHEPGGTRCSTHGTLLCGGCTGCTHPRTASMIARPSDLIRRRRLYRSTTVSVLANSCSSSTHAPLVGCRATTAPSPGDRWQQRRPSPSPCTPRCGCRATTFCEEGKGGVEIEEK